MKRIYPNPEIFTNAKKNEPAQQNKYKDWPNYKPTSPESFKKWQIAHQLLDLPEYEINECLNINLRKFYETELGLKLGKPKEYGWAPNVLCPFHDDTKPSLGINLKKGSFKCFGCERKGNTRRFYQARYRINPVKAVIKLIEFSGLDLYSIKIPDPAKAENITNTYDYIDQNGELRFQICRLENKKFRARHKSENGNWVWNLNNLKRIPYNLPAVINANRVFIVEGEKDADTLVNIELTASCNPFGAGRWKDDYGEYFRDKKIIILPDNDEPGIEHAQEVAHSLKDTAKSIKIVKLSNLPEKGDVSDWLHAGNTKEQLLTECHTADLWSPGSNQKHLTTRKALSTISIQDLLEKNFDNRIEVIGRGILPEEGGLIIAGESGVGKSLITLEWALHLGEGKDILDELLPVPASRRIVFFQCENPEPLIQKRVRNMISNTELENPRNGIFFSNPAFQFDLLDSDCIKEIIQTLIKLRSDVCIFDPLSSFHSVNENDNTKMRQVLDNITHVCRRTGAAAIVVHHFGKPSEGRSDSNRYRGASSIKDWCDTLITLTGKDHEHKTLRILTFEKLRHGGKIRPILMERNEKTFLHQATEEEGIITPKQVHKLLIEKFNGKVEKQGDLVDAAMPKFACSDKTAVKAINEAVKGGLIIKKKDGQKNVLTAKMS